MPACDGEAPPDALAAHYTRAGDGEGIYQENGYGPSPTNLLTE